MEYIAYVIMLQQYALSGLDYVLKISQLHYYYFKIFNKIFDSIIYYMNLIKFEITFGCCRARIHVHVGTYIYCLWGGSRVVVFVIPAAPHTEQCN